MELETQDVEGKTGQFGYEEFNADDFEQAKPNQDAENEDDPTPDPIQSEDGKLSPEEAFGDDPAEEVDDPDQDDEALKLDDDGNSIESDPDNADYEPNLTYKVLDQEKEFPEEVKGLVKDKASEDAIRSLLCKADGIEEIKVKRQQALAERDEFKTKAETLTHTVNRSLQLRDKHPHLFSAELGLTDEWIMARANEISEAHENPQKLQAFNESRKTAYDNYVQSVSLESERESINQEFIKRHNESMESALNQPAIKDFSAKFDAINGSGAFREEVRKHGNWHYTETKQNLPPLEAASFVYERLSKLVPTTTDASVEKEAGAEQPPAPRKRTKTLPNTGRGRNVSPTSSKPKNLKEMRKKINRELGG